MSNAVKQVIIVGGGSAGWLTAAVLAADHGTAAGTGLQVTLIESPDVGPIGVGEGTWPTLRDTLRRIGVSESDFIRECDASFKQGSRFDNWVTGGNDPGSVSPGRVSRGRARPERADQALQGSEGASHAAPSDHYYHPFVLPHGYTETNLVAGWLQRHPEIPFADLVSFQPHLCARGKAPKQAATPEYAAVANYAYHLDAGKFGLFLRKHCTEKLGVRLVLDHVVGINSHENGDIASLQTRAQGPLAGDLFVDCTGMQSLLLGKHYGVAFRSQKHVLFNDTALALQIAYTEENSPIASQTISTAQSNGWVWDIGLPTRRGVGHVYSSSHTSDDAAEVELRNYIHQSGGPQELGAARKLTFSPGYRDKFWHRNCVAVGLAAGFIEPLEASAIALVELSAAMLSDEMPRTRAAMDITARRFNDSFTYRWERVIEFLKMHYVLSQRSDSAFWLDNRRAESIPDRLSELLTLWRHQPPSRYDLYRVEEVFPSASYQYVLYGMGFRPHRSDLTRRADDAGRADGFFREAAALTVKMLAALPSNRELIGHIASRGLPRI